MVAGGVGLAPFPQSRRRPPRPRRRVGAVSTAPAPAGELFHLDAFRRLGVRLALATDDGSRGDHGRVTLPLERALRRLDPAVPLRLYACGPTR